MFDPGLLYVRFRYSLANFQVEASLKREAERIIDLDTIVDEWTSAVFAERCDVLNARTDIRLKSAHAVEVILKRQSWREDPEIGNLGTIHSASKLAKQQNNSTAKFLFMK